MGSPAPKIAYCMQHLPRQFKRIPSLDTPPRSLLQVMLLWLPTSCKHADKMYQQDSDQMNEYGTDASLRPALYNPHNIFIAF